jgi:hypothetical protein
LVACRSSLCAFRSSRVLRLTFSVTASALSTLSALLVACRSSLCAFRSSRVLRLTFSVTASALSTLSALLVACRSSLGAFRSSRVLWLTFSVTASALSACGPVRSQSVECHRNELSFIGCCDRGVLFVRCLSIFLLDSLTQRSCTRGQPYAIVCPGAHDR